MPTYSNSEEIKMPNECYNKIIVRGNKSEVARLEAFVTSRNSDFDFEKIVPFTTPDGKWDYDWVWKNWGTKWNAWGINAYQEGEDLIYTFMTAWGPSLLVTTRLAAQFPNLEIIHWFEEPNADFSGRSVFRNGKEVLSEEGGFGDFRLHDDDWFYNDFDWDDSDTEEDEPDKKEENSEL
jgi:hypothetical protein